MNQGRGTTADRNAGAFLVPRFVFCFVLACAGCRANSELVEAELRTKESQLRDARGELFRLESHNDSLQRELCELRRGPAKTTPELAAQITSLKSITLGRSTGGVDDDGKPGDEALQVLVEPRDGDNSVIKAPGCLHVVALQINTEGAKQPIGAWDVSPEQLRSSWKSGVFSTGYSFTFPWKTCPTAPKLRVTAQFTLADGRYFEADKDVTVRLIPSAERKPSIPVPGPTPPAPLPGPPLEEIPGPSLPDTRLRTPSTVAAAPSLWQPAALCKSVRMLKPVATGP